MNTPTLYDILSKKLEQKRKEHPSFRLMEIDDSLFPNAQTTHSTLVLEAIDSNNKLKTVKEIVAESWGKGSKHHLMIEGEGGIGKTVTLLSIPGKFTPSSEPFPSIYIPLHEIRGEFDTIEKYIRKRVLNNKEDLFGQLLDFIDKPWDNGPQLMLLLDGFNEIAAENRQFVSDDIKYWSEFPGIQIVTSSRYDIHTYVFLSYDYSTIKLQPLSGNTIENYLKSAGIPIPADIAVKTFLTIPLLLTLYVKTELIQRQRETRSSSFRKIENAGSIVWNYLQCELWRFGIEDEDAKNAIIAMEFITPYMAWQMQKNSLFFLDKEQFNKYLENAYQLLKSHFDKPSDFRFHIQDALQKANGLPSLQLIRSLLEKHICLFVENGEQYRLMHQQFRDALAALHLINLSYLSGKSFLQEWSTPIDHYVMQFVADLISEEEANRLWEQNRDSITPIEDATRNQLRLQGLLHNNDFTHLNFSSLDLSNISLYPYRSNKTTIKLPTQPERMDRIKLSDKTFSRGGHEDRVNSIFVNPNGKCIVSGSSDKTIRVWDIETGEQVGLPIKGHEDSVNAVAMTPDGKHIVSGSDDETIRIWDIVTSEQVGVPIKGHKGSVNAVAITSDGKRIVSKSDNTIQVWDLETGAPIGKPIKRRDLDWDYWEWGSAVTVVPDSKHIVSGYGHTIRIWDLESGICLKKFEGHKGIVNAITVTLDGRLIVSGSRDSTIRIWDLESGICLKTLEGHESGVNSVVLTPDGKQIVSGSYDDTIRVWNMETGEQIGTPIRDFWVNAVAVTPDSKRFVSGSYDGTIRIWDLESRICLKTLKKHEDDVKAVTVTPNDMYIISGSDDNIIRIWDLESRVCLKTLEGHEDGVNAITVTQDGRLIVSGSRDNTIRIWDSESGICLKTLAGHEGGVNSVALTPDWRQIVSGSDDDTIRIWDLESGSCLNVLDGQGFGVISVTVSIDGKRIISGSSDHTISIWDLERGVCLKTLEGHENGVNAIAELSDKRRIVSGAVDGTICITNIDTYEEKTIHILPLNLIGLNFSKAIFSTPELKETLRQNGAKV